MANRRPPWKIPNIINPPNRRCVQINIPDDPEHIAIFWGLLRSLSDWQRWEREPTKSGTLVAQVWREVVYAVDFTGEECMACCPEPTNQRYTEDGILEVSYDGGLTWEERRDLDPRFNAPLMPPLPGTDGDAKRCLAANNASGYIKSIADQLIADGTAWNSITALLAAIGAIIVILLSIGSGGALTPLLLGLVVALVGTGLAAFDAAMTETVYGDLNCIFYCHCGNDGVYTEAAWQAVKADILAQFDGIVEKFLYDTVNAMGLAGLNNAARAGVSSGEPCDECGCGDNCATKYIAGVVAGIPRATNIVYDGDYIEFNLYDNYGYIMAETQGDCCFLGSIEVISGTAAASAFVPCGGNFPGDLVGQTGIGQCAQWYEFQGSPAARVRCHFGECP